MPQKGPEILSFLSGYFLQTAEMPTQCFSKGAECFELLTVELVVNNVTLLIGTLHSFVKLGREKEKADPS